MTHADAQRILSGITLGGAFFAFSPRFRLSEDCATLTTDIRAPDRESAPLPVMDADPATEAEAWQMTRAYSVALMEASFTRQTVDNPVPFWPMTKMQLLAFALECVRDMLEHELAEAFLYRGARLFDPHSEAA